MAQVIKVKGQKQHYQHPLVLIYFTHEISMNVNDGKIFTKAANISIVELANKVTPGATEADVLAFAIALG